MTLRRQLELAIVASILLGLPVIALFAIVALAVHGNIFVLVALIGVGAATALSGAVVGTLIPQSSAAMDAFVPLTVTRLLEGGIMLAGTVLTLAYFQFSASRTADGTVKRNVIFEGLAWGGRVFIAITFGVLFAGVYMAALTAMLERLSAIINFLKPLFGS